MRGTKRNTMARICVFIALCILAFPVFAQKNQTQSTKIEVSDPVYPRVLNINLADLPVIDTWRAGDPIREIPRRRTSAGLEKYTAQPQIDAHLDIQALVEGTGNTKAFTTPGLNFAGLDYSGANPPDTVGAVGKDYFIQSTNGSGTAYVIYDKLTGNAVAGPFSLSSFSACSGSGDPVILYDHIAERWFLSEFGSGNSFCVLISQSSDPINGGWFEYNFTTPSFPDYPKYGIWPDAYYVGTNESSCAVYALERAEMLLGNPARSIRADAPDQTGFGFQALTPSSCSGDLDPTGQPNYFMRHSDDEVHNPGNNNPTEDYLEIWSFNIDWVTTANSTFTGPESIAIAEIDSDLNGLTAFSCFQQPGTSVELDPLREVVMFPVYYRKFSDHESLLGTLVTDVDTTDHGGIRWFELRKTTGAWSLYQEGTYAPDSDSRWMSSAAMDQKGNIAIGYNVSSTNTYPSLRYIGRLSTDPLGTVPSGESIIADGTASNSSNRYGDYSAMSVDPVDQCTFWFTGMYNLTSSWTTRIASMSFESCLCTPLPSPTGLAATANGNNVIDVTWTAVPGAESYFVYRAQDTCPTDKWSLLASGVVGTSYTDSTPSGGVAYSYTATSYDLQEDCESPKTECVTETTTGDCFLLPAFSGIQSVVDPKSCTCSLDLSWNAGSATCFGSVSYNVYRGDTIDFVPGPSNMIASCLTSLTYTDFDVNSYQTYYYIVRAEDSTGVAAGPCSNGNIELNTVVLSGAPSGPDAIFFEDDLESGETNWAFETASGLVSDAWSLQDDAANAHSTSHVLFVENVSNIQDQRISTSTPMVIPAGAPARLSFWSKYNMENNYDAGVLEYSVNGGTNWYDILQGNGGSIPAGPNRFIQGEYNDNSLSGSSGPLYQRATWTGDSGGYGEVIVDLTDFGGQDLLLRWRQGSDGSVSRDGWWIDDIRVFYGTACDSSGCICFSVTASTPSDLLCAGANVILNAQVSNGTPIYHYSWTPSGTLTLPDSATPTANPLETTTYTVSVSDGNPTPCEAIDTITIYVFNLTGTKQDHWLEWAHPSTSPYDMNGNGFTEVLDFIELFNSCTAVK